MDIFKQLKLSICTYYLIIFPCNVDLTPHFYIGKQGYTLFSFFAIKHSNETVLKCTHDLCLSKNKEQITCFHMKLYYIGLFNIVV